MTPTTIGRTTAAIMLASIMLACAVKVARLGNESEAPVQPVHDAGDPLVDELARCSVLGDAAANDEACRAAWRKSRERFFREGTPYQGRPIDLFPTAPDAPVPKGSPKLFLDRHPSGLPTDREVAPLDKSEGR